jgi:hypothetical protein
MRNDMSKSVRTTVVIGANEWEFVVEDAKRVLDADDYKGPNNFNFSKYCRRVLAQRKDDLRKGRARGARKAA